MSSPVTTPLPLTHVVRLVLARLILGPPTPAPAPAERPWWEQQPGTR